MPGFRVHRSHLVRGAVVAHDALAAGLALLLGMSLRLGSLPESDLVLPVIGFMAITGVVGYFCGLNRGVWRYASLAELEAIAKTATLAILAFSLALFLVNRLDTVPRASIVICWGALVLLLSGSRLAYRLLRTRRAQLGAEERRNVLLLGTSASAENFLKATSERGDMPYNVVGLLDDRDRRTGLSIRGYRVLGCARNLDAVLAKLGRRGIGIEALILTKAGTGRDDEVFDIVAESAKRHCIQMLRLPAMSELQGEDAISRVPVPKPLVLEDLLPRRAVNLKKDEVSKLVQGATVLVTGAGGSIGSELCRQLMALKPRRLVMVDSSEYLLYSIDNELTRTAGNVEIVSRLGNVRNRNQIRQLFDEQRPDLVFHAAALKHVPMVEHQPLEGLNTNVLGTRNVADAALAVDAKAMVLISTDKAVNPTNVMGASKRMAESYCQALDLVGRTHFVTVRFGNVLGSAGSVVPLFEKQIRAGGPVTITHPEIERYFMTIPEASQLVLHATTYGVGEKEGRGRIFVLDMGKPVKIIDVARKMIRLAGYEPDKGIEIKIVGLRPGEKMHEELFRTSEELVATNVDGVLSASPRCKFSHSELAVMCDELAGAVVDGKLPIAFQLINTLVPEYTPDQRLAANLKSAQPRLRLLVTS